MGSALVAVGLIVIYVLLPCGLIWGWVRWAKSVKHPGMAAALSLAGFGFATASALLATGSLIYAHVIGGFGYYDPRLLRIYKWGALLSLAGTLLGVGGIWKQNALRWYAVGCSLGMLLFWAFAAAGE